MKCSDTTAVRFSSFLENALVSRVNRLAEHYEVSYGTVRRAMEVLRERGLIITTHGRGTFVSAPRDSG
jgi:GntR family transcriptional regulator